MTATDLFRQSRDFLLAHRTDYVRAYEDFEWPRFEQFNWALDWFDVVARGNIRTALRVVGTGDATTLETLLVFPSGVIVMVEKKKLLVLKLVRL